jgi:hypothetical protein
MNNTIEKIAFLFLLLLPLLGFTQNGGFMGMGNASVMLYDFWAINNNQAGLADIESPEIGVCYDHNYQLWETGMQSMGYVLPTKSGNFALSGKRYGYSGYAEHNFGLAYARNLGKMFSASLEFDYLFYTQSEYSGIREAFLFQVGIISRPIENLQIGLHVYNPGMVSLKNYEEQRVPTVVRFGLGYYFSNQVVYTVETEMDIDNEVRFKTGLQYEAIEHFFIRTGFLTQPNQFSLGIGYTLNKLTTDFAIITHESLQLSSQISFKYAF